MRSSSTIRLAGNVLVVGAALTWMSSHTAVAPAPEQPEPRYVPVPERPRLTLVPPPPPE